MELVSQHVKKIMEECKVRARDEGLKFDDETKALWDAPCDTPYFTVA